MEEGSWCEVKKYKDSCKDRIFESDGRGEGQRETRPVELRLGKCRKLRVYFTVKDTFCLPLPWGRSLPLGT